MGADNQNLWNSEWWIWHFGQYCEIRSIFKNKFVLFHYIYKHSNYLVSMCNQYSGSFNARIILPFELLPRLNKMSLSSGRYFIVIMRNTNNRNSIFFIFTGSTFVCLLLNRTSFYWLIIHDWLKNSFEDELTINSMVPSNEQIRYHFPIQINGNCGV